MDGYENWNKPAESGNASKQNRPQELKKFIDELLSGKVKGETDKFNNIGELLQGPRVLDYDTQINFCSYLVRYITDKGQQGKTWEDIMAGIHTLSKLIFFEGGYPNGTEEIYDKIHREVLCNEFVGKSVKKMMAFELSYSSGALSDKDKDLFFSWIENNPELLFFDPIAQKLQWWKCVKTAIRLVDTNSDKDNK